MPNTISENLARLQTAKTNIANAITNKGGTVNQGDGLEDYASDIASIPVAEDIFAFLYITVESGTTVIINKGTTTLDSQTSTGASLLFKIPESGTWTATATKGTDIATDTISITESIDYYLTLGFAKIYGAEWDGTSSTVLTRTDDAVNFPNPNPYYSGMSGTPSSSFDNIMPWSGMIVEEKDGNSLVKIPKFWYKITRDNGKIKWQISNGAQEGFKVSPAHKIGNTEYDYVYIGRYKCSSNDYKSQTGKSPKVSITRATARTSIHNLSSTEDLVYWQQDFKMFWTIRMLYLVEFANWNSQSCIGYGGGNGSSTQITGASDSMPYHTGTMQTGRTTYGVGCQYRNIEDLWGNVTEWCDGIYFSGLDVYVIDIPSNFSDSTGGVLVGTRISPVNCISNFLIPSDSNYDYALYPNAVVSDSTYSTYITDSCDFYRYSVVLYVGGGFNQNQGLGLFYLGGVLSASENSNNIGTRLIAYPS